MKKDSNNIEQQFSSRFEQYEYDFDQTAMWQGLNATLPQQIAPRWGYYALAAALVISISISFLWSNYQIEETYSTTSPIVDMDQKANANAVGAIAPTNASNTQVEAASSNTLATQVSVESMGIGERNTSNSIQQQKLQKSIAVSTPSPQYDKIISQLPSGNTPTSKQQISLDNELTYTNSTLIAQTSNTKSTVLGGVKAVGEAKQQVVRNNSKILSLLPSKSSNALFAPNLLQKETTKRDGELGCPFGARNPMRISGRPFIDIYGEGDMNFTTVEAQNTDNDNYERTWNETDTPLGSYELGVLLGYQFDGGLYAAAGLEYQRTVEKLEYQQTVIERVTVWSDEAYFYIDESGNQVFVGDSVTTESRYERSVVSGKEHTLLNLPLMLGYNLKSNRLNVGIFGGANINLSHKFEGKIINESNNFVTLDEDNYEMVYKRKIGASFFAGVHLGYDMTNHMELYLNPTFRMYPNSWMQDDYSLSAKYRLGGLRLGLRYKM